jgi:hypothetical protein
MSALASEGRPVTIVRVGTNQKYSDGWETAFGKRKSAKAATKSSGSKTAAKKSAKKSKKK